MPILEFNSKIGTPSEGIVASCIQLPFNDPSEGTVALGNTLHPPKPCFGLLFFRSWNRVRQRPFWRHFDVLAASFPQA